MKIRKIKRVLSRKNASLETIEVDQPARKRPNAFHELLVWTIQDLDFGFGFPIPLLLSIFRSKVDFKNVFEDGIRKKQITNKELF